MKPHRNTIWLIPLFFIITFPLWSAPVGKFLKPRGSFDPEMKKSLEEKREFNLNRVKITQNQNGRQTALIRADKAKTGANPDILFMDNVNADIYDEEGDVTNIVARKGEYNTVTKRLILTTDVVIHKIKDDQTLYTDLLHYDNDARTVFCPGPTKLVARDTVINSGNLFYDIPTERYELSNRVHCTLSNFDEPK